MSMRLTARRTASALSSVPSEASTCLVRVFNSALTALLRSWALALVLLRFFWLLMLAMGLCASFVDRSSRAGGSCSERP